MNVIEARAEFISIVAFLAWSVVYQPVSETFAAHVSWQTFVGSSKPGKPGSALAILMVNYMLQVCSAFAVWVYWNRPGTNTEMHIATLSCWIFRAFLYRLAMSVYKLSEEHVAFRIVMDSLLVVIDLTFEILVLVEAIQRQEGLFLVTFFLFLPTFVLDFLVLLSMILWLPARRPIDD